MARIEETNCNKCGGKLPDKSPPEGVTSLFRLHTEVKKYRLRLNRYRWRWMPEDPYDRVSATYTDLHLCNDCVVLVWDFATEYLDYEREKKRK